ncbi:triphosphoribosyl-dephospho-CoA synthase [Methanolobus chelungpuianus]
MLTASMGKFGLASYIARCTQLAMCLEVSASPKPGNIDRQDDYEDTRYEHFLASAVSIYPVIEEASGREYGIGRAIKDAVTESTGWQKGGNTHFGAIILLVPLAMAAGKILAGKDTFAISELTTCAHEIVKGTCVEDAVDFYSCFETAGVRVNPAEEYDLRDSSAAGELLEKNVSLYDLMEIARGYDMIANEWTSGFPRCAECAEMIIKGMNGRITPGPGADINDVIVYTFLHILSGNEDTFITTKFDARTANYVSGHAGSIIEKMKNLRELHKIYNNGHEFDAVRPLIKEMDRELLERKINPGSTADIVIAGLFISLLGGLRY